MRLQGSGDEEYTSMQVRNGQKSVIVVAAFVSYSHSKYYIE